MRAAAKICKERARNPEAEVVTINQCKQKNIALDAANIKGNGELETNDDAVSFFDYTTCVKTRQAGAIESALMHGEANAISSKELIKIVGCKNARALQAMIAQERKQGALILSRSKGGYFLPSYGNKGREEVEAFVHTLQARAFNTLGALRTARKMLNVFPGQEEMRL